MAVTKEGLKASIIDKVNALSDDDKKSSLKVHTAWAEGISEYLLGNVEVDGVYAGILPGPPPVPDPLSGPYVWELTSMTIVGATLMAAGVTGFAAWVLAIQTGIQTGVLAGNDITSVVTYLGSSLLSAFLLTTLTPLEMEGITLFEDAVGKIADHIITNLTVILPVPPVGVAVSITPTSTGTVTFTAIR